MFGIGWPEMMIIGVVALIVIGPEDLPDMFRQMGRFTAKLRSMSREFSRAMDQAAKDSGVRDVAKDLKTITSPKAMGLDAVKSAADKFEKWDPIKNAAKPATPLASSTMTAKPLVPPPMPATASSLVSSAAMPAGQVPVTPAMPLPMGAMPTIDDSAEADDDLADHSDSMMTVTAPAEPIHGPATQALYDKQAARAAVIAEQTAKLKAIEDGSYMPVNSILPPVMVDVAPPEKLAPKKRVAKAKATEPATTPKAAEPKPKTPRKPKKADLA